MKILVRVVGWIISCVKLRRPPGHRRVAISSVVRGDVVMGDYTYVGARSEVRGTLSGVRIGRYCSIGRDVKIFSAGQNHVFSGLSTYPFFVLDRGLDRKDFNPLLGETRIGNDVWIGSNAILMAGIKVGDGAVIGAGAIVTDDIPPYGVAVGAPARVVRMRFPAQVVERVVASEWWALDYPDLIAKYPEHVGRNFPVSESSEL